MSGIQASLGWFVITLPLTPAGPGQVDELFFPGNTIVIPLARPWLTPFQSLACPPSWPHISSWVGAKSYIRGGQSQLLSQLAGQLLELGESFNIQSQIFPNPKENK